MITAIPRNAWTPFTMLGVEGRLARVTRHFLHLYEHQVFKATRGTTTVEIRFDDSCHNGRQSFAVTGETPSACGCIHNDVAQAFPEFAHLLKWHLCDTSGPMHYVANTVCHAEEHGPTYAWVYFTGPNDPQRIGGVKESLLKYAKAPDAKHAEGQPGYHVQWDEKTVKVRNLDHARSCAVWPDATDAQLCAEPEVLKATLLARLPELLAEFRATLASLGLEWKEVQP